MTWESGLFLFAVFMAAVLLFIMVFFIIMFSDLECDFINPIDLCKKLNQFILPEYALHAVLVVMFLLGGQFMALAWNLPLLGYHVYNFQKQRHVLDATEIFRTLSMHKKEAFAKLGFYMLSFFYYLYRMILALLES
ncbi:hypothetical protein MP228_005471 [Amoeboaphelidium protococcarum]|nr:hypothetical protein MP228_005471 [Amoeboaphelidium protococcarum]